MVGSTGVANGNSATATANLANAPGSVDPAWCSSSSNKGLGATAPAASPAMTNDFYSQQGPGSVGVYHSVPATRTSRSRSPARRGGASLWRSAGPARRTPQRRRPAARGRATPGRRSPPARSAPRCLGPPARRRAPSRTRSLDRSRLRPPRAPPAAPPWAQQPRVATAATARPRASPRPRPGRTGGTPAMAATATISSRRARAGREWPQQSSGRLRQC